MAQHMTAAVDEDAALLQFPKEFENAETLLISEVNSTAIWQCFTYYR